MCIRDSIDIELKKLYTRTEELGYKTEISDEAKVFLVDKGYDEKFGARPLSRAIQKHVEDPLADYIINAQISEGDTIYIELAEDGTAVRVRVEPSLEEEESPKED